MIRRLLHAALLVSSIFLTSSLELSAQLSNTSSTAVEVTGVGKTKWNAQSDAIRQALEQTMKQLVIADRAIKNDEIIKDQVLSTLNGFVERFEVLQERFADGEYQLDSRVTVSPTNISNYIATGGKPGKSVAADGTTMLAEINALKEKASRNAAIARRILEGMPFNAVTARIIPPLKPNPRDETVTVTVGIRLDPDFIKTLNQTLVAVVKTQDKPGSDFPDGAIFLDGKYVGFSPISKDWLRTIPWSNAFTSNIMPVLLATEQRAFLTGGWTGGYVGISSNDNKPLEAGKCNRRLFFAASSGTYIGVQPSDGKDLQFANAVSFDSGESICEFSIPTAFFEGAKNLTVEVTPIPDRWHFGSDQTWNGRSYIEYGTYRIPSNIQIRGEQWLRDTTTVNPRDPRYRGNMIGFLSFWRRNDVTGSNVEEGGTAVSARACEQLPRTLGLPADWNRHALLSFNSASALPLCEVEDSLRSGGIPDNVGTFSIELGNAIFERATKQEPADEQRVLSALAYFLFAETVSVDENVRRNASFLVGVASYLIVQRTIRSVTESPTCEVAKRGKYFSDLSRRSTTTGVEIGPEYARKVLNGLTQLVPCFDKQVQLLCD